MSVFYTYAFICPALTPIQAAKEVAIEEGTDKGVLDWYVAALEKGEARSEVADKVKAYNIICPDLTPVEAARKVAIEEGTDKRVLDWYVAALERSEFGSYNFALLAEKVPGSGQWLIVRYCSTLGSLVHSAGGGDNVFNMDPGETRDHRKDAHNRVIFRMQRIDVRVVSIEQIKKVAEANVDVWKAALVRLEMAKKINGKVQAVATTKVINRCSLE